MDNKLNKKIKNVVLCIVFSLAILSPISALGIKPGTNIFEQEVGNWRIIVNIFNNEQSIYQGHLRVYIVEPVSRWNMYDGNPYHYGFLDYAIDKEVSIDDTYIKNMTWNPDTIGGMDENNIMLIAALFNATPHERYADENRPFDAYFVDAAAGVTPGSTGQNQVTSKFTHTIFAEEATATWCPHCPDAADTLNTIYESDDYPFYFVSLVSDKNNQANYRCNDYNVYGIPVTFFDGGYHVEIGAPWTIEDDYRDHIESCGTRTVPDIDLNISFFWDPDVKPPTISITKPEKNSLYIMNEKKKDLNMTVIVGITSIEVETDDSESDVERVEFYINNQLREEDNTWPFSFSNWRESKLFGKYEIKVIAYDEAENQAVDTMNVFRFF